MNTEQRHANRFEERLLVELRREVVARQTAAAPKSGRAVRPWVPLGWRRRVALAGAVAVVLGAGAAVGLPILSGSTPAYAVTSNGDGTVTVEINDLSDAEGLERKLREAGVPAAVNYLPLGKTCEAPWFTPWQSDGGRVTSGVSTGAGGTTRFTIAADTLPADVTLVVTTQTGAPTNTPAGTAIGIAIAFAKGEVGPCQAVDAPAGAPPFPAPATGAGGGPSLTSKEDGAGPGLDVAD